MYVADATNTDIHMMSVWLALYEEDWHAWFMKRIWLTWIFAFVIPGKDTQCMIQSLYVAICKDLLPILSMEDVDNCKDHFCIGNAFYVSICGGFFCNKAMEDLPCSEVRWPQWHSGDQGSPWTDNCEILLFASNLFNFRLVGCASALLCWF